MDNIFIQEQYESDDSSSEEEVYNRPNNTFMNMTKIEDFEKNQKLLFNRDIVKKNIVIDSHNYYQGDDGDGEKFNSSNFTVLFDLDQEKKQEDQYQDKITTDYEIFKNVIGFRLLKTTIRTPPYNINSTNNVIKYTRTNNVNNLGSARDITEVLTITINPGVYTTTDLANVFQQFEGYYDQNINEGADQRINIEKKNAHFVTYSDSEAGLSAYNASTKEDNKQKKWNPWIPSDNKDNENLSKGITDNTFRVTFIETNHKSENTRSSSVPYNGPIKSNNDNCSGVRFLFEFDSAEPLPAEADASDNLFKQIEEFTILWDYDSITRGAARLFGFVPEKKTSSNRELLSNKMANFDSQYVDLVIPEIPSIACKKNSSGREIIERIQLKEGHGEYLHYKTPNDGIEQQYFNPIKLHRLTAQLWSVNNILYDNDNSDISYEFEITMVKNKKLLI